MDEAGTPPEQREIGIVKVVLGFAWIAQCQHLADNVRVEQGYGVAKSKCWIGTPRALVAAWSPNTLTVRVLGRCPTL